MTDEASSESLRHTVEELARRARMIPPAIDGALTAVDFPEPVRQWLTSTASEVVDLVLSTVDQLRQLLEGAAAPVMFFRYAGGWEQLHATTTGVTGELVPELMPAAHAWAGEAATAYTGATGPQRDAVAELSTLATTISTTLTTCALAGGAFYTAVAVVVAQMVWGLVGALAAIATGVGAPVGLGVLVSAMAVNGFYLAAIVSTFVMLLGAQATTFTTLTGVAGDATTFPGGHWPSPISDTYSDATVTDGDADWSVRD